MQYFPIFLLVLLALVTVTRALTTLLHELGHAIPAILLTKQKVTIYIGSYGDPKKSLNFQIGKLEIYFRYNPFAWKLGLCIPSAENISINRQIIYVLTGPITSLIIAIAACYFAFVYDMHGLLKLFLIVFLGSSILDLLTNLVPRSRPVKLYDGTLAYNDGYNLAMLFYYKRLPKAWMKAAELYMQQRYSEAAVLYNKMLSDGVKDDIIFRYAISSYLQDKNYLKAKFLTDQFFEIGKPDGNDFAAASFLCIKLGQYEIANEFSDKCLLEEPNNKGALNNKGYSLNLLNRYEEAIPYFDRAIKLDNGFAYSYNNRGLAKIKTGQEQEGLKDINHSLKLDSGNSYGYRNLGIYHLDRGEYEDALTLFLKAKELDDTTHLIDEFIAETRQKMQGSAI